MQGIDISQFQGSVDWKKIAAAMDFAIIRAVYGNQSVDGMFSRQRVSEANAALAGPDKFVAYYDYGYPDPGDAASEADHFIDSVESRGGKLTVVKFHGVDVPTGWIDYEEYISNGKDLNWLRHYVGRYEHRNGHKPGIYGGNVLRERLGSEDFGCPLWLAAYVQDYKPYVPAGWKDTGPLIWQNTARFTCPGVAGPCDHDVWIGGH